MISDDTLAVSQPVAPAADLWAQPRIMLANGRLAAYALRAPAAPGAVPMRMDALLYAACAVALGEDICVCVDMSGPVAALPGLMLSALRRSGVEPHQIELSATLDQIDEAGHDGPLALSALRAMGVGIALAGFNAAAVPHLRGLSLTRAVLAAEVLHDVPASRAANAHLHAIVNVARREGLLVSATGVETETQRAVLSGFGCEQGEGTLFGPPQPVLLEHREAA